MPNIKKKLSVTRVKKILARVAIRPPNRPSNGARTLKQALGTMAMVVRTDPVPRQYTTMINWGNSSLPTFSGRIFNRPSAVALAANKLTAFTAMAARGVPVPEFSTTVPERSTKTVIWLARTTLTGSSGEGIVVVRPEDEFPNAPLYVRYIRKDVEYRIHVAFGRAIFLQQKKRRLEGEQTENQKLIRNYDNGWVFCPVEDEDVEGTPMQAVLEAARTAAVDAVAACGLDFGAVDLVLDRNNQNAPMVLEINTAPGLSSPGLIQAYADAFRQGVASG